jgi:cysteinyl-tRNA synthetase
LSLKKGLEGVDIEALTELFGKMKRIADIIKLREQLKKENNFTEADKIRKELENKGIILEDNKDGKTTWRKKL